MPAYLQEEEFDITAMMMPMMMMLMVVVMASTTPSAPTEKTLTISTQGNGTTSPSPGTYRYAQGTTATVYAIASSGWEFNHWLLDGVSKSGTPISVIMSADHSLVAVFSQVGVQRTLTISAEGNGTTSPAPGSHIYSDGEVANVTATPDTGWKFDHWVLDSQILTANPVSITMNKDYALKAVFVEEGVTGAEVQSFTFVEES